MLRARPPAPIAMPARRVMASSPTNVSRQPAEPHLQRGPVGSTVMWPNSPPNPWEPRKSSPSMKMPPPTPISPNTQTKFSASRATPCQCSASAARFDSLSARTARCGRSGSRAAISSATRISDQPRFGAQSRVPVCASTRPGAQRRHPAGDQLAGPRPRRGPRPPSGRGGREPGCGDERRLSVWTRRS